MLVKLLVARVEVSVPGSHVDGRECHEEVVGGRLFLWLPTERVTVVP